jgi:hypothetical protein
MEPNQNIWEYAVLYPNSISIPPPVEPTTEEKDSLKYVDKLEERFKFAGIENLIYNIDEITETMKKEANVSDIDDNTKIFNIKRTANKLKFTKDSEIKKIIDNILKSNKINLIQKYIDALEIIIKKRKDMRTSLSKLLYGSTATSMDGSIRRSSRRRSSRKRSSRRRSSRRRSSRKRSSRRRS